MFPGLAILTVVLAFNFLGDSLRDALDPRGVARDRRAGNGMSLLEVDDLRVSVPARDGQLSVVDGVSLRGRGGSRLRDRRRERQRQDHVRAGG